MKYGCEYSHSLPQLSWGRRSAKSSESSGDSCDHLSGSAENSSGAGKFSATSPAARDARGDLFPRRYSHASAMSTNKLHTQVSHPDPRGDSEVRRVGGS